jgi:hypothetical protein
VPIPQPGQPIAGPVHWHACMELSDMGWPLRGIAQHLREKWPETFERPPSPESVRGWAAKGREEWERVTEDGRAHLDPAEVRPAMARRIRRMMGELDMARTAGVLPLADQIPLHVLLERLEAKLVGTDAPKVSHHTFGGVVPTVHSGTAAVVDNTPSPGPPQRSP